MKVFFEPLNLFTDQRGSLFEPLSAKAFGNQKNAHIVISKPGVVRGNHYHMKGEETAAIMGPALVRFRENGETIDVEIPGKEVYRFIFPPGIPHAIKNVSHGPNILVAFNTVEHDKRNPDSAKCILLEDGKSS